MATPTISFSEYLRLTRENRNFRKLWCAQIVSEIGDWFYTIAIFSLLLDLTGKAQSVAIGLVLWVLPQTFVGPIAGAVNDRISRRKVMITADLARVVIVGSMLLVRSASMAWLIYPLILLETVMAGFFEPARNAVIPNITPEEDVIVANTLASTTWSFNLAIGSLIGAVVAATLGREAVFVINALSFLVSALFISRMQFDEPHVTHQRLTVREVFDYSPMIEGFRYIGHDLKMLAMVALRGGAGILGASWVLYPVFGQRVLPMPNLGRQDYALVGMSILLTARGIGSLIGPLIASQWAGINQPRLRHGVLVGFVIGGDRLRAAWYLSDNLDRCGGRIAGPRRQLGGVGIFHDIVTTQLGRPLSRQNLRRRLRPCHGGHRAVGVAVREGNRWRRVAPTGGDRRRREHDHTDSAVGFSAAAVETGSECCSRGVRGSLRNPCGIVHVGPRVLRTGAAMTGNQGHRRTYGDRVFQ